MDDVLVQVIVWIIAVAIASNVTAAGNFGSFAIAAIRVIAAPVPWRNSACVPALRVEPSNGWRGGSCWRHSDRRWPILRPKNDIASAVKRSSVRMPTAKRIVASPVFTAAACTASAPKPA